MHRIINPYKMALAVREDKVGKKEYATYVFIFVMLSLLNALLPTPQTETSSVRHVFYTLSILGFLIPLAVAFVANRQGDNHHFWYRFVSINIPITLVLLIFFLVAVFLHASIFPQSVAIDALPPLSWYNLLLITLFSLVENILIYRYIHIASSLAPNSPAKP